MTAIRGTIAAGAAACLIVSGVSTVLTRRGVAPDPGARSAAQRDRLVPIGWIGTWQIVTRFFDLQSGRLDASDRFTESIRAGEAFGLSAAGPHVRCQDSLGDRFAISCELTALVDGCLRSGHFEIRGSVIDDVMTARGVWTHRAIGACGWFAAASGQRVEIDARRIGPAAVSGGSSTTLLSTLAHDPSLLQLALR